jgi:hypothetical protein
VLKGEKDIKFGKQKHRTTNDKERKKNERKTERPLE